MNALNCSIGGLNLSLPCPLIRVSARAPWVENLGKDLGKVIETLMILNSPLQWLRPLLRGQWHVRDKKMTLITWTRSPSWTNFMCGNLIFKARGRIAWQEKEDIFPLICVITVSQTLSLRTRWPTILSPSAKTINRDWKCLLCLHNIVSWPRRYKRLSALLFSAVKPISSRL